MCDNIAATIEYSFNEWKDGYPTMVLLKHVVQGYPVKRKLFKLTEMTQDEQEQYVQLDNNR